MLTLNIILELIRSLGGHHAIATAPPYPHPLSFDDFLKLRIREELDLNNLEEVQDYMDVLKHYTIFTKEKKDERNCPNFSK